MTTLTNVTNQTKTRASPRKAPVARVLAIPAKPMMKSRLRTTGTVKKAGASADASSLDVLGNTVILYSHDKGVDDFVDQVKFATPLQLVDAERKGIDGRFLKDISRRMNVPSTRVFTMLGVPRATAEKKAASGEVVSGSGGQAAIALAKLLGTAQAIVANSTAPEAQGFDSAAWLGHWLERPQPSLGGRKPADLIDTPTGFAVVSRLLGALQSGAYQ